MLGVARALQPYKDENRSLLKSGGYLALILFSMYPKVTYQFLSSQFSSNLGQNRIIFLLKKAWMTPILEWISHLQLAS